MSMTYISLLLTLEELWDILPNWQHHYVLPPRSGLQIKTTLKFHLTPIRMAITNNTTNNKYWRGCQEKGTFIYCWWECKVVQPLWKMIWRLLKKTKDRTAIWSSNITSSDTQRNVNQFKIKSTEYLCLLQHYSQ
jgi:hypothetical protein